MTYNNCKRMLEICIKYNDISHFICGERLCKICSDPHDRTSSHSFYTSQLTLNEYHRENPQIGIDRLYVDTVKQILLDRENYGNKYTYDVFKSISTQLSFEKNGKASFFVTKNDLLDILKKLESNISFFSDILKNKKYDEGIFFEDGVYGYLKPAFDELYENVCREHGITYDI